MYLSRFGVKNYKCLGEIDIPLTPIHVFIGQNDCGKTSLLEAMEAFFTSSEKPLNEVFPKPWAGRELVRHANEKPEIEFWGEWKIQTPNEASTNYPNLRYGLLVNFPLNGADCRAIDQWIETDEGKRPVWSKQQVQLTSILHWKMGRDLPKPAFIDDVKVVASILKPVHKYAFDARLMALPATIDQVRKFRLDSDGFGLATLLDDILGFDPNLFLSLREDFCRRFPQFKSVRIESEKATKRSYTPDGMRQTTMDIGKGIFFETKSGETVRARHASDGAILFLGFLALASLPDPPNLLLIEEPENGVYPKRLGQVIELLKQLVHRTDGVRFPQIILTTHSPYVLSFFEPEEVTLLSRPSEPADAPVRARPLRDAPNIRERLGSEFYLGELWYNLSEEDLFGGQ